MKLKSEDSSIVIGLHRMVSDIDRETRQICSGFGLTLGQFAVLEALRTKGPLTVGQVKALVLSSDGTIPVIAGNLEKQGYIVREQDSCDRRKYILSLTDRGRELIDRVCPENNRRLTELLSPLSAEDKKELRSAIGKYRAHRKKNGEKENI